MLCKLPLITNSYYQFLFNFRLFFDTKSIPGYDIFYGLNAIALFWVVYGIFAIDSFFVNLCIHLVACLQNLRDMIKEMDESIKSSQNERKSLDEIVRFHNKFYEYFY